MHLQNTAERFGSLTKFLHWSITGLFCIQFFLVYRREYFPKDAPEKLQYILLHKSFGVCVFILAVLMILARQMGTRPIMPLSMSRLEIFAARSVHFLLYLSMLGMPITGFLMSSYAGYGVSLFGYPLPNPVEKNPILSDVFSKIHQIASFVIIGLVFAHTIAALFHHFVRKDNILKRML